jgi:hypothetical protein
MDYHPKLNEADRRATAIADGLAIWGGVMAGIKPPVEVGEAIVTLVKIAGLKSGTPESFMAASEALVGGFGNIPKPSLFNRLKTFIQG